MLRVWRRAAACQSALGFGCPAAAVVSARVAPTAAAASKFPPLPVFTKSTNPLSARGKRRAMRRQGQAEEALRAEATGLETAVGGPGGGHQRRLEDQLGGPGRTGGGGTRRGAAARRGALVAEDAKVMSDMQWEAVPLRDKHAFTKHIADALRDRPSTVTEQQRRRFYETTARDPRDTEAAGATVTSLEERVRLGLAAPIEGPGGGVLGRSLGVTQSIYDSVSRGGGGEDGDGPSIFDPQQAHRVEHAMTHVKQLFVDYVRRRKEGTSTEAERRALANASEALNHETQRHLAGMYQHAESTVYDVLREERRRQLADIAVVRRRMAAGRRGVSAGTAGAGAADGTVDASTPVAKRLKRRQRMALTLRDAYGVDLEAAEAIWRQMAAQEKFLRLCEVMVRMTKGAGFTHTPADESLDEYTQRLQDVYSVDPERLGAMPPAMYLAATEGEQPVDWASRWYAKVLVLPLQQTAEFREAEEIRREDIAAIAQTAAGGAVQLGGEGVAGGAVASQPIMAPADEAVRLAEQMFTAPADPRAEPLHQQRLRHVAHVHMQSQLRRMRANARLFADAADAAEAPRCRELYERIQSRQQMLTGGSAGTAEAGADGNIFAADPVAREAYEELHRLVSAFIERTVAADGSARAAKRAARVASAIASRDPSRLAAEARRAARRRRRAQADRILRLLERDVREDMLWLDTVAEAERPPLLPIPEPMAYVSAADVAQWEELRQKQAAFKANPLAKAGHGVDGHERAFREPTLFGQPWSIPDKPTLFWGTGHAAVEQALQSAAEDAARRRDQGAVLPPPYPCAENPWGWRVREDPLDTEPGGPTAREAQSASTFAAAQFET